jgi:alginate O-acetyltransferase complex protein AlgI
MLFTSSEFLFGFLPVTFAVFFWIGKWKPAAAAGWLAIASIFFYGWWNPKFVALLLASIALNYAAGVLIARSKHGFKILTAAVSVDLILLGVFKYSNFFIATVNDVSGFGWTLTHIVLPLGISFFTFTQIAFLVDVHRKIAAEFNFVHYLLFITYFPHLIAGPVLHHKQMMPQFGDQRTYRLNFDSIAIGLTLFSIGMAKKILIADPISQFANPVFSAASAGHTPSLLAAWSGALAYTFQLYFDFSGYSDMAIGISRLFGIQLPINFNSPYKSTNIIEFWRRWHMTLSQFLRDYLYIPLGGNRHGATRRYVNLGLTMILGGLWHGANWTFVFWGTLHGLFLCVNHLWVSIRTRAGFPPRNTVVGRLAGVVVTFVSVVVAWVFFRADSFHAANLMLTGMAGGHADIGWNALLGTLGIEKFALYGALAASITWLMPNPYQILSGRDGALLVLPTKAERVMERSIVPFLISVIAAALVFASVIVQFGPASASPFLYFQF